MGVSGREKQPFLQDSWLEAALLRRAQKVTVFVKILSLQPLDTRDSHLSGTQRSQYLKRALLKEKNKSY